MSNNWAGKENSKCAAIETQTTLNSCNANISDMATPNAISAQKSSSSANKKTSFKKIGTRKLVRMIGASPTSANSKHLKAIYEPSSSQTSRNAQTPVSGTSRQSKSSNTKASTFKNQARRFFLTTSVHFDIANCVHRGVQLWRDPTAVCLWSTRGGTPTHIPALSWLLVPEQEHHHNITMWRPPAADGRNGVEATVRLVPAHNERPSGQLIERTCSPRR